MLCKRTSTKLAAIIVLSIALVGSGCGPKADPEVKDQPPVGGEQATGRLPEDKE
jgi:hypothetical protein